MIKVSVIIPVYKVPLEYLRVCLDSLYTQTMQECEFIMVSDGAPNEECSVCQEYTLKDSRFLFFQREHEGASAARNFGINQAEGEFVTFVDSDDWIEKETCEITYAFAKKHNSDIVFWDSTITGEKDTKSNFHSTDIPLLNSENINICLNNIIAPQSEHYNVCLTVCKLISKKIIKKNNLQFDSDLILGEDRVFNFQSFNATSSISYLKRNLYHYRQNINSVIQSYRSQKFNEYLKYIKKLNILSNGSFQKSLANETINSFYSCLFSLYKANLKTTVLLKELIFLKNQISDYFFHNIIQKAELPDYLKGSLLMRLELSLMKQKIAIMFNLRIIKMRVFHHLGSSH